MLTPVQFELARLVSLGYGNRDIAHITNYAPYTVKNAIRAIFDKVGVWSRLELALWFIEHEEEYALLERV